MKTVIAVIVVAAGLAVGTDASARMSDPGGGGVPSCTQAVAQNELLTPVWAIVPGMTEWEGKYMCVCPQAWEGAPIYWCGWELTWIRPRAGSFITIKQ